MCIRRLAGLGILLASIVCVRPADAALITISFDEFAADNTNGPMPGDRYSALGVTFVATDDGTTWGGLTNGDPGNWGLDGTNGPIFSGFNGGSYGLTMLFDPGITSFSLDVSRSNGSSPDDTFTAEAWSQGGLLQSETVALGDINTWITVALGGPNTADEIRFFGSGSDFHPFGVDNITFETVETVPEPFTVLLLGTGIAAVGFKRYRRSK